jgi:hypothetical protein
MAICKYCNQETGATIFCQNCGAKMDAQPEVPQAAPVISQPIPDPTQVQQTYMQQMQVPAQQDYYVPKGAAGLLAANIIVLVLSVIFFCGILPLASVALSIIGIVFSVKAGHARGPLEEKSQKSVALIMLILGIVFLVLGIVVIVASILSKYGSFNAFWEDILETSK